MNERKKIIQAYPYINGKFITDLKHFDCYSPIDDSKIGEVYHLDEAKLRILYKSANFSFSIWKNVLPKIRIKKILEFNELLLAHKDELATSMTYEIAKGYKDCVVEIERTYDYIKQTVDIYQKEFLEPFQIDESTHNIKGKVGKFYHVPLGVVLAIAPFNYPINLALAKIVPALLTGNCVVLKPATQGSLTSYLLTKLIHQVNLIPGAFSLILGRGKDIGQAIITDPHIKGISFTGGSDVGKNIAKYNPMHQVILEMGGKDPAIVTQNNSDFDKVASEIIKGAFNYSGQRCTAIKRVLVDEAVAHVLVEALLKKIETLSIGNPFENNVIVPLINKASLDYNLELINDAIEHQCDVLTGNNVVGHNLLAPTLIDHVSLKARIAWEEPFGPVLPVIRYHKLSEAIKIVNDSNYGLQASIFSEDLDEAKKIANQLDVGTVNINRSSSRGPDIFPFIGVKDSGFGVQGIKDSLLAMTRIKGIVYNS